MKTLKFDYRMTIDFSQPVTEHYFSLKCLPKTSARQEIIERRIKVSPNDYYEISYDGFGNETLYGVYQQAHQKFEVDVTGIARVDWAAYDQDASLIYLYKMATGLTKMSSAMETFARESIESERFSIVGNLNKAQMIMDAICEQIEYESGSTNIRTTAAEAFAQKKGVCQDYAHVMIAFCRYFDIPARYVAGMMIGEGYSHAWVEIYSNRRWYGFDPTNHLLIDSNYIILAVGRDYNDCVLNKGHFMGLCSQDQKIYVNVEEQ